MLKSISLCNIIHLNYSSVSHNLTDGNNTKKLTTSSNESFYCHYNQLQCIDFLPGVDSYFIELIYVLPTFLRYYVTSV